MFNNVINIIIMINNVLLREYNNVLLREYNNVNNVLLREYNNVNDGGHSGGGRASRALLLHNSTRLWRISQRNAVT